MLLVLDEDITAQKKGLRRVTGKDEDKRALAAIAHKVASFIGAAESRVTDIPGLTLYRHTAPTAFAAVVYEPSIAVVVQGRKQVALGGSTLMYDASRFLLTSVDLPVTSKVVQASKDSPYLCLRLKLDMALVREILSREEFDMPVGPSDAPGMATTAMTAELLAAFGRLLDLQHTPGDIAFLSPWIQREIVYRVLKSRAGQRLRLIATAGDQSQRTVKVIAWIRANFAKPLRMGDLARIAGMSMSTLHHHFRQITSMSPLQYQKQLRLQAARQRMIADGLDAASAAFAVGYESASQFNREYSRFFGRPPLRDVRAVRSSVSSSLEAISR